MRDDFTEETKRIIASRVNSCCSNPACRASTSGPQLDPTKSLNVGVAAHITAASPGGPRYNPSLSSEERRHASNGTWLCQSCAKEVDNDAKRFTETLLHQWKGTAEAEALIRIGKTATSAEPSQSNWSAEELELLVAAAETGEIHRHYADEIGEWLSAGTRHFLDQSDRAVAAAYTEALESLRSRRLVKHQGGDLYELTGSGFKIARALKQQESSVTEQEATGLPEIPLDLASLTAYIRGSQRVRDLDKRIAEEASVELIKSENASLPLLEKAQYFGVKNIAELDAIVKAQGEQPYRLSHYLHPQGKAVVGYSLHYVFEILAARLESVDKFAAYLESLKYTVTNSRAWAEEVMHCYEQIKLYDR